MIDFIGEAIPQLDIFQSYPFEIDGRNVGTFELMERYNKLANALNHIIENCNLAEKHKPEYMPDESEHTKGQYLVIDNIRIKLIEDLK